ncbi:MaoC/PaaZ C-terminal domain-containing protein [Pseudonocardia pini]|uniref:MaoC/PaaZ C-terminal domain-containing protein n=1 Tax=Pseudonocardia pini TaxID=2758030 RepID=UPI0035E43268
MPIELGKVREYALATGADRPEYLATDTPPVPPTFLATVVYWERLSAVFETPEAAAAFEEAGIEADVRRLLSLEQEYVFAGPPPRAGDVLETRLRFDGVTAKEGRRGGRMLLVHFAVEFHGPGSPDREASGPGALRAECRYTSAYLTGSSPAPAGRGERRALPPSELPERRYGPLTMTDIVRYQGASGDMNPMHHDDELARSAGYPEAFGVGMLGAGYLAAHLTDLYGAESVRLFRTRFRELVWRGDRLRAGGVVVREFEAEGEKRAELALQLHTDGGALAVDCRAEVAV